MSYSPTTIVLKAEVLYLAGEKLGKGIYPNNIMRMIAAKKRCNEHSHIQESVKNTAIQNISANALCMEWNMLFYRGFFAILRKQSHGNQLIHSQNKIGEVGTGRFAPRSNRLVLKHITMTIKFICRTMSVYVRSLRCEGLNYEVNN